MLLKTTPYFYILLLATLLCCQQNPQNRGECYRFLDNYQAEQKVDTVKINTNTLYKYYVERLEYVDEKPVKGQPYETYQLYYSTAFGYGELVRFEKKSDGCYVYRKCFAKGKDWQPNCENYQVKISMEDWTILEKMIYEYNFWTTQNFRENEALDGYVYLLEGNRPDAEMCGMKTFNIIGRVSPRYDKMGDLCVNIRHYADELKSKYEQ